MVIEELVKTVLTELRAITKTETVVGDPITMDKVTIVPVSKISVGFGAGGGRQDTKNGGEATGGGVSIEPVAFFVVRDDKVELITVKKEDVGFGRVMELVPQIFEKVKGYKEKKAKAAEDEKDGA